MYQWSLWSKTYELLFEKPRKIGTTNETYGLRSVSYTGEKLWNDLSLLSNDVEIEDFKSLMTILSTEHLDPTFTYV